MLHARPIPGINTAGGDDLSRKPREGKPALREMPVVMVLALLIALTTTAVTPAYAGSPKTTLADVEDEVMCPVCGVPLAMAGDAPLAIRERAFIVGLVARGNSKAQIKNAMAAEFGDAVLTMPKNRGFGRVAYLTPAAGVAAGLMLALVAAVRWRRRRSSGDSAGTEATLLEADARVRLAADIERYDL